MPDMSEDPQPNKSAEPTPEQLLKLLDLQIAASRARRGDAPRRRMVVLVAAVLLIIAGTLIALLILQQMVADLPRPARAIETPVMGQKSQ